LVLGPGMDPVAVGLPVRRVASCHAEVCLAPKVLRRRVVTTWQQIADYLGVTIRSAQKWKNERGLPVFTELLRAFADMLVLGSVQLSRLDLNL